MAAVLYRCPVTKTNVQSCIIHNPLKRDSDAYEAVACPSCSRVHYVSPKTGRVLSENSDE
jgi:hypothetical protein